MFNPKPNLLCRVGLHRWTQDYHQGDDELARTSEHYCSQCHIDRFHANGNSTTRAERCIDAIYYPIARLRYRIHKHFHHHPSPTYPNPSPPSPQHVVALATSTERVPGTPMLIAVISRKHPPSQT